MLTSEMLKAKFEAALPYREYVATGKPEHRENWESFEKQIALTDQQASLIRSFARRINVLVSSGTWCGDCVQQCPMLAKIEAANPSRIAVRLLDRDEHPDLAEKIRICEGLRVPTAIFLNEDFDFVSLLGDRTLNRYRAIASRKLGASCPLPGAAVAQDEIAATLRDWVDEFERVHLLLRLSPKLRQRHGD